MRRRGRDRRAARPPPRVRQPAGTYGTGLQTLIDQGAWRDRADLAEAYLAWSGYAYGGSGAVEPARADLERASRASTRCCRPRQPRARRARLRRLLPVPGASPRPSRRPRPEVALYHGDNANPEAPACAPAGIARACSCAAAWSTRSGSPACSATATRAPPRWRRRRLRVRLRRHHRSGRGLSVRHAERRLPARRVKPRLSRHHNPGRCGR